MATSVGGPVGSALPRPPEWTSGGLGSWISGPAAVRADKVVLASLEGKVIALNTADGKPAWRRPVDVSSTLHAGILLDRYGDGPVCAYVGGADGRLHEVDLIARRDRVLLEAAAPIQGTPVRAGERLCALSADGQVHAVDPASGERRVLHQMGTPAVGSLAAAAGAIYAAGADGGLRSIDASTGQLNWQFPTKGLVVAKPLVAVDAIYVGGTDCVLRRIAAGNGRQLHASELSAPVHADPAHYGNRLYIASGDGVVHAYDIGPRTPTRLEELWSHPLEEEISGLAAAARGHIYIAAGRRLVKLTEVDQSARRPSLLLTTDSLIAASPTISAERCYVVSLSGQVSCLRLSLPMVRI